MSVSIIDQAYNAGAEFAQKGILTIDVINDFRTEHFADSSTHEAHHLIPQKLLIITGILKVSEGPSIRMKKEDHELTRSYKRGYMLRNDFFRKQQEYLEALNIREAVEMEIAEIKAKFGSKYDDAIREVREYVTKLEKQLKNHNGGINEKANS